MEQNLSLGKLKSVFSDGLYSPKLETRRSENGMGNFAAVKIFKGEIVVRWDGYTVPAVGLAGLPPEIRRNGVQIGRDLYLIPRQLEPKDFFNHSCEPNLGLAGLRTLVAMRDIETGEELCYDYAMSDSSAYDEFPCRCGTASCRGQVSGQDWKLPQLQIKYRGFFSVYLGL